jgi:hypothetical protein
MHLSNGVLCKFVKKQTEDYELFPKEIVFSFITIPDEQIIM